MMRKTLLAGLFLLFLSLPGYGSETLYSGSPTGGDTIITFRFVPGEDMFYVPYGGNNTELDRLYALDGRIPGGITSGANACRCGWLLRLGRNTRSKF